jgi:cytochrome c5
MSISKICNSCGEDKLLEEFSKQANRKDGLRGDCRICNRLKAVAWQRANPEKRKATLRRAQAKYRERNPEKIKADNKKFKELNPDYGKNWRKNNPEKTREYSKRHYAKGLSKALERNRKRKALLLSGQHAPYTEQQVLDLYGTNCYLCHEPIDLTAPRWTKYAGWERGLHIEHVVDVVLGGADTLENVRPSHGLCNLQKPPNKESKDN